MLQYFALSKYLIDINHIFCMCVFMHVKVHMCARGCGGHRITPGVVLKNAGLLLGLGNSTSSTTVLKSQNLLRDLPI